MKKPKLFDIGATFAVSALVSGSILFNPKLLEELVIAFAPVAAIATWAIMKWIEQAMGLPTAEPLPPNYDSSVVLCISVHLFLVFGGLGGGSLYMWGAGLASLVVGLTIIELRLPKPLKI